MRRPTAALMGLFLLGASGAQAGDEALAPLIGKLRSGEAVAKRGLIAAGPAAIQPLFALLAEKDGGAAWEARSALRWIALRASDGSAEQRKAVFEAALPYLDPQQPEAARRAAIEILGLVADASSDQARPLANIALREPLLADEALAAIGRSRGGARVLGCIVSHDGGHVADVVDLTPAPPAVKARAFELLASQPVDDGGYPNVTIAFLRNMAANPDERVQVAAMKAFGAWGHPDGEPILIEAIQKGPAAVSDAAFDALLAVAVAREEPAAASVAIDRALMLAKTDPQRAKALAALGRLGDPSSLPMVTAQLGSESFAVRGAACMALCNVRGPAGLQAMVAALAAAPNDLKPRLLEAIAAHRDPATARALLAAAHDKDETVALAGIRALERLGETSAASGLLDLAERAGAAEAVKAAAVRVAIRLGHALADRGQGPAAFGLLERALGLAATDALRREAVLGMGMAGDAKALRALAPILGDKAGPLRPAAVEAALAIGDAAMARQERSDGAAAYAAVAHTDAPEAAEAIKKLSTLGVHPDLAARGGYITAWWVIGPFPCGDLGGAPKKAWPPEAEVDLKKSYRVDNRTLRWRLERFDHPKGYTVLKGRLKPDDRVLAYCYTELASEADRDVQLLFARDDGLSLWLNGKELYNTHDGFSIDREEFAVAARLVKGINRILVKSSQGGADWQFYLRIAEPKAR